MRRGWMLAGVVILAAVPAVPVAASGVSLVLERVGAVQDGVGTWLRTGDTQRFRVRVNGMSVGGGRVAVAVSPVAALSVACGGLPTAGREGFAVGSGAARLADRALTLAGAAERDDAVVSPGARVCRLGSAAEARSVDVTVMAPAGVGQVVLAAVAKVRPEAGGAAETLEKTFATPVLSAESVVGGQVVGGPAVGGRVLTGPTVGGPAVEGAVSGVADGGRWSLPAPAGSDQTVTAPTTPRCFPSHRCPSFDLDQPQQLTAEVVTGNAGPGWPGGEQSLPPGGEQPVRSGAGQPVRPEVGQRVGAEVGQQVRPVAGQQTGQTRHARQAWGNRRARQAGQAGQVGHGQQVSVESRALPQAPGVPPALGVPPAQAVAPAQGVPPAQAVAPVAPRVRTAPQRRVGARGRAVRSAQVAPRAQAVPPAQAVPEAQAMPSGQVPARAQVAPPAQAAPRTQAATPAQVAPGAQGVPSVQAAPRGRAVASAQKAPRAQAGTPAQAVPPVQAPAVQGVTGLGAPQQVQGGQGVTGGVMPGAAIPPVAAGTGQALSGLRLPEVAGGDAMLDVPPGLAGGPPGDGPFVPPLGGGGLAAPLPIEVRMAHERPRPVAAVVNPLKGSLGHVLAAAAVATLLAGLWGIVTVQRRSKRKILR